MKSKKKKTKEGARSLVVVEAGVKVEEEDGVVVDEEEYII